MSRHSAAIDELCEQRKLSRDSFAENARRELSFDITPGLTMPPAGKFLWDDVRHELSAIRPDAHKIVNGELHCYEVVDKSHLTDDKRRRYARLWASLDSFDVRLRLFVADLYGNCHEHSIANWFYRLNLADPGGDSGFDGVCEADEPEGVAGSE